MPTPAERRALLFVATVAALGIGVRGCRTLGGPAVPESDRESLARQIAAVDSAVASGGRRRPTKAKATATATASGPASTPRVTIPPAAPAGPEPASPASLLDLNRASIAELDALPGIGPALAARIVADREANGGFGTLADLQRVKGIGPALAAKLAPYVTFSAPLRPTRAVGTQRQGVHP